MSHEAIKRYDGSVIVPAGKYENIKEVVKAHKRDLRGSDLSWSNLSGSDLSGSDLRGSDLRWSNLSGSDLSGSDLRESDLRGSDLRGSDLRESDLSGSDLRESDLDFSSWPLWCGSFRVKACKKIAVQLLCHAAGVHSSDKEIREIQQMIVDKLWRKFHRKDECKLPDYLKEKP